MCGINGFNWNDKNLVKKLNESLKHRGPDKGGAYSDKNISLGHRRLAVIDLSKKADQPMTYSHKKSKAIIVFNGEIYNFQEIKNTLIKKGYKFKSNSDTEVILASYFEWGHDCVKKFNGMWAFCIYDPQKNILFLSRDRVGKKPLYYYFDNKKFIFSSELKTILKHNIKPKLNKNAIDLYFSLGFIPAPYSIYQNIQKLEQRQSLIFNLNKKTISKEFYYDWPDFNPTKNKVQLKKEFDKLIKNSIKLRMISDVPLGAFMSGGLDSPTIVHYAKQFNKNINTYSIGFEGENDETQEINILKNHFKTNHNHKYFKEQDFKKELENIFYYYDEPFSDTSMFPTKFLSSFAKEKLTVSLSGDGGDEIFGGYPRYKMAWQMTILRKLPRFIRKILTVIPYTKLKEGLRLSLLDKEKFYSEARRNFYKPEITKKILEEKLKQSLKKTSGNLVEAIRLMDINFYTLPDNFLTKVDRASMANSLEVRCPFLDYRLLEYSMKLPTNFKTTLFEDKPFFKERISNFLPKEIITKKKKGFTPPIESWIQREEYKKELNSILKNLEENKIISKEWTNFYRKEIFPNNTIVHNNYKIRLFLFHKWYKFWKEPKLFS
jgi:asparagine synthase (glutamine-hydrolysing)